jgi:hypothetical protein
MKIISNHISTIRIIIALLFLFLAFCVLPKNDRGFVLLGKLYRKVNEEMEKI